MGVLTGFLLPKMGDLHRGWKFPQEGVIWGVEKCPLARTPAPKGAAVMGPKQLRRG